MGDSHNSANITEGGDSYMNEKAKERQNRRLMRALMREAVETAVSENHENRQKELQQQLQKQLKRGNDQTTISKQELEAKPSKSNGRKTQLNRPSASSLNSKVRITFQIENKKVKSKVCVFSRMETTMDALLKEACSKLKITKSKEKKSAWLFIDDNDNRIVLLQEDIQYLSNDAILTLSVRDKEQVLEEFYSGEKKGAKMERKKKRRNRKNGRKRISG